MTGYISLMLLTISVFFGYYEGHAREMKARERDYKMMMSIYLVKNMYNTGTYISYDQK